jgi:hypothetical protein
MESIIKSKIPQIEISRQYLAKWILPTVEEGAIPPQQ